MSDRKFFTVWITLGLLLVTAAGYAMNIGEDPKFPAGCKDPEFVGVLLKEPGDMEFRSNVQFPEYTTHERMEIYRCASGYAWFGSVILVDHGDK